MVHLPVTRRFTVDEYYRMADAGILTEDDRVELIEGEIVELPPIGSRHAACVDRLNRLFVTQVGDRAIVRVQNPIRLSERSEPEPDLALVRARPGFYAEAHPGPGDLLLIVEVAETSFDYDRSVKSRLYARAGIPELWIVELQRDRVEVFSEPRADGYHTTRVYRRGNRLAVTALASLNVPVEAILGEARASR